MARRVSCIATGHTMQLVVQRRLHICSLLLLLLSTLVLALVLGIGRTTGFEIAEANYETLKSLIIVMRHGDRTPITIGTKNYNNKQHFWPDGLGMLTNQGKQRAYGQGLLTRLRYRNFLTDDPREIYARSSTMDRCLNSAELALAGMYVPRDSGHSKRSASSSAGSSWSQRVHWQPIPVYTLPTHLDSLLEASSACPIIESHKLALKQSERVQHLRARMRPITELAQRDLGLKLDHWWKIGWLTYDLLPQERHLCPECRLPGWYNASTKALLANATIDCFKLISSTPMLQELYSGPLLAEMVNRFENPAYNDWENIERHKRVFLYVTHDSEIAALLNTLNIYDNDLVGYSATLYFELHDDPARGGAYVEVYYNKDGKAKSLRRLNLLCGAMAATNTNTTTNNNNNNDIQRDRQDSKRHDYADHDLDSDGKPVVMCLFDQFKRMVQNINRHDYKAVCSGHHDGAPLEYTSN